MSFEMSAGLARELDIRSARKDELLQYLGSSANLESWTVGSNKNLVVEQTRRIAHFLPPKASVLDVGFGVGFSSLELGRLGFSVTGVEPSAVNIEIASRAAEKFAIKFRGVHSTAEEMKNSLSRSFDAVYFNSSLHHCDDPQAALQNAYDLLRENGVVILVEPTLKPWRTKAWFFRQLETNPIRLGHYGGNEHIYYNWEYDRMLRRAGFKRITYSSILSVMDLRSQIVTKVQWKTGGEFTHGLIGIAARAGYYAMVEKVSQMRLFNALYRQLSLGDGLWTARRDSVV
jgi:2-polyprenyl-3-methyl-5-hydroxy-6-metoxy-1,4-benzoquinol methylase